MTPAVRFGKGGMGALHFSLGGAFQFWGIAKLTSPQANFSAKKRHFDESSRRNPTQMAGMGTGFLGGPRNGTGFTSPQLKIMSNLPSLPPN